MKRLFTMSFLFAYSFIATFAICMLIGNTNYEAAGYKLGGDSDDVLTSEYQVNNYLTSKFSGKKNLTFIQNGSDVKVDSKNFSQTTLNNYYETQMGVNVENTCSIVAVTSVLEFYSRVKEEIYAVNEKEVFIDVMSIALSEGYTSETDGTSNTKIDNIMTAVFGFYGSDHSGNNDYLDIYDTIKTETKNNKSLVFSIVGHSMVGAGYRQYKVQYTETTGTLWWKKTVTKTEYVNFVIVNDGWSNYRQYSYFPESSISTNVIDRWEFGITKVL